MVVTEAVCVVVDAAVVVVDDVVAPDVVFSSEAKVVDDAPDSAPRVVVVAVSAVPNEHPLAISAKATTTSFHTTITALLTFAPADHYQILRAPATTDRQTHPCSRDTRVCCEGGSNLRAVALDDCFDDQRDQRDLADVIATPHVSKELVGVSTLGELGTKARPQPIAYSTFLCRTNGVNLSAGFHGPIRYVPYRCCSRRDGSRHHSCRIARYRPDKA